MSTPCAYGAFEWCVQTYSYGIAEICVTARMLKRILLSKKKHKFCCNCIESELYLSVEYFFDGSICLRRDDLIPRSIVLRFRLVIGVELRNQRKGHKQYVSECTDYIYIQLIWYTYLGRVFFWRNNDSRCWEFVCSRFHCDEYWGKIRM